MITLREKWLFTIGLAGLLLPSCTLDPLGSGGRGDGLGSVSLSSSYNAPSVIVPGDTWSLLSVFPPCKASGAAMRVAFPARAKTAAPFKEARVMVLNEFNAQRNLASAGKVDFYCAMTMSNFETFTGRELDCWNDLVTGMSHYLSLELVHTGLLKRSGDYLEGDILVRPGTNIVLVCFIDEFETIIWTTAAEYIYQSGALSGLMPPGRGPLSDGWVARTAWNAALQRFDTLVWEDRQYMIEQIQDSAGLFVGYILPKVGPIGYTQAYADAACNWYRQTINGPTVRAMRRIVTKDRQGQIGGVPVSFSRDFFIDTTEVTQAEYQSVMGANPSSNVGSLLPVENVSWFDAVRFCIKLSARAGLVNCYDTAAWTCDLSKNGYRLPTEAEWLFAYQAGTTTKYFWGDTMDGRYVWYGLNSNGQTHPVAQKLPNGFGLYDMAGNVWEWSHDWNNGLPQQGAVDWTGPPNGTNRVLRGGQYGNYNNGTQDGTLCFSISFRYGEVPSSVTPYNGFRCARSAISE